MFGSKCNRIQKTGDLEMRKSLKDFKLLGCDVG
jgi:hypothetical protein